MQLVSVFNQIDANQPINQIMIDDSWEANYVLKPRVYTLPKSAVIIIRTEQHAIENRYKVEPVKGNKSFFRFKSHLGDLTEPTIFVADVAK